MRQNEIMNNVFDSDECINSDEGIKGILDKCTTAWSYFRKYKHRVLSLAQETGQKRLINELMN